MNISFRFGVIIFILLAFLNAGVADPIYKSIETYLVKYRQSIKSDDLTLQNETVHLVMHGRRTNIKSQLLLGFYSIGRVLQKSNTPFREVQIIINYDLKERQTVITKAPIENI